MLIYSTSKNPEIKLYCPSCKEQKEYSIKVDLNLYRKQEAIRKKRAIAQQEATKKQEKIMFEQRITPFKDKCKEIGFKPGTDKFRNCLMELMN